MPGVCRRNKAENEVSPTLGKNLLPQDKIAAAREAALLTETEADRGSPSCALSRCLPGSLELLLLAETHTEPAR